MNKAIEVKICVGTLCSVMGGSDLQLLEEHLPQEWQEKVRIVGSTCLDVCKDREKYGNPPFASVDGTIVPGATIVSLMELIREKIERGENR